MAGLPPCVVRCEKEWNFGTELKRKKRSRKLRGYKKGLSFPPRISLQRGRTLLACFSQKGQTELRNLHFVTPETTQPKGEMPFSHTI